ncbi:MAG: SRPBCC domain-containing protein [Phycisphaerales bacterium]|nr:SRPBCC domain-containing protein [Phycisphaerales bacterium]
MRVQAALVAVFAVAAWAGGRAEAQDARVKDWVVVVDAPVEEVWDAFTTKEGMESWAVPLVGECDFRVGGVMRTNYNPDAGPDDPGWITHHILAFEPRRMYAGRFDAPPNTPMVKIAEQVWSVTTFEPVGESRTRVRLAMCGWGEGPEWQAAEEFFERGNQWTFDRLRARFPAPERAPAARVMEELHRFAEGEWILENRRADGGVFRVRNLMTKGPGGQGLVARGWLGDENGMFEHAAMLVHVEPGTDEVRFEGIYENAAVARGTVTLDAAGALVWEWTHLDPSGAATPFHITMRFLDDDRYTQTMRRRLPDGTWATFMEGEFRRVGTAPEEFLRIR